MQEWLYGENGYYREKHIGKKGDFFTSVSVSAFFGYTIAEFLKDKIDKNTAIVEIGAEKGDLISDIALYLKENQIITNYHIIEPLSELRAIQKATFYQKTKSDSLSIFSDFAPLKDKYERILFVANELFDAFVCDLYYKESLAFIEDSKLVFEEAPQECKNIAQSLNLEITEIPKEAESFVENLSKCAQKWLFLTFDYGEITGRNEFSLRIYKDHKTQNFFSSQNPLKYDNSLLSLFQKCDITYDVNFNFWGNVFKKYDAREVFLHRQNRALVDMGLDRVGEWFIERFGLENFIKQSAKIRSLISPSLLGERFLGACYSNFI